MYPLAMHANPGMQVYPPATLVNALSVARVGTQSTVSTLFPTDTMVLNASSLDLVGALSITHTGMVSTICTQAPGDTLHLSADLINADGHVEVTGTVSCASGIINVGTSGASVAGISIGDSHTSNSFLWHRESDVNHWELVGGDLRVTRVRSDVPQSRVVSYTIKIADDDALEIHQSTSNSTGPSSHRRVARFGGP